MHGNFGGIVTDAARFPRRHRLLARRRGHFLYTAQHRFRPHERVTLFLMNPCPTAERVELFETLPGAGEDRARLRSSPFPRSGCAAAGSRGWTDTSRCAPGSLPAAP